MAVVSQTMTTLTPPSSSHGTGYSWDISMSGQQENPLRDGKSWASDEPHFSSNRPLPPSQNGTSGSFEPTLKTDPAPRKYSTIEGGTETRSRMNEPTYLSAHPHKDLRGRSGKENESPANSLLDLYDVTRDDRVKDPLSDDNNWIHRDKLARIESQELQAAGIFLPRPRDRDRDSLRSKSQNRAKRDTGQDQGSGQGRAVNGPDQTTTRSRKNSAAATSDPKTPEGPATPSWDLRLPEEIAAEGDGYWVSVGGKGSRIPVAKMSPVPIPNEHLERDKLLVRKRDNSPGDDDALAYPRTRARSSSTGNALAKTTNHSNPTPQPSKPASPRKTTPAAGGRKPPAGKPANGAAGRPKTRGGPSKDSTSSGGGTRPSTRSGERELSIGSSKQMEGEPPWMVSAYRPDPRLPPDQQLLPTVAKRLQQEKWEREGKFGNVYDKEFRPLTDEGFLKPPEPGASPDKDEDQDENAKDGQDDQDGDWPLRVETKSSGMPARSSSYSTMPKISDKATMSPLSSPRPASQPPRPASVVRVPEPPEDPPNKKNGCGCCVVM